MDQPHPAPYDQLSPPSSVADQIWDMALTDPDYASHILDTENAAAPLPVRLTRLAHMASQLDPLSKIDAGTLHHCLDTLESLLDPRPGLSQEVARCRPHSLSRSTNSVASFSTTDSQESEDSLPAPQEVSHPQLKDILGEVTALKVEFDRRREESADIYDLLRRERQALTRRMSELENEIQELQMDILEDSAEREAIEGTIHGLESWVDEWHRQRLATAVARKPGATSRRNGQRRWSKCRMDDVDHDGEALFEGLTAWMRGWKDVEEGFRIRERDRGLRREERQKARADIYKGHCPVELGH
ncbi:hypothetical protein BO70DRAFT_359900 [Aspergillus heteromorphus CBS 117.55]|uniref:Uncharacterized protein n=1 Tax=Aspergillus heteromorphus CBS 117.55 TaxID=1448321 RepID=A0A317WRU6_9EURO|nr:uncharacterized protein BO70DRAFT_359900 [Aspergillus heteromorphus CBS 117.55]PWY88451.1 hypothetical protein BO70DRAFT_359900 [Aspergillus heteromorphus CBS 117.55]